MNQHYSVHAPLETMSVWVNDTVFYNLEKDSDNWVKVKVFGLTCLKGRVPTFEILTQEGYVFSDIPPHLLRWQAPLHKEPGHELSVFKQFYALSSLVYNNCLSEEFALASFPELMARHAFTYFKAEARYEKAHYWFSLDFYRNNNWYHCLKLANGQLAFIPSHKIVFSDNPDLPENHVFPDYKKLRHEFKV